MEHGTLSHAPQLTAPTSDAPERANGRKKRDPLANMRASEARRPGFHFRAATPADEKDLI
jgi:hypothetical protein